VLTVPDRFYFLQVWIPSLFCFIMGMTQVISDLNSFSANIADFRHLHSPEHKLKRGANIDIIPEKGKYFFI